MGTGAQGGYFAVTTWLPTFLRTERGLSVLDSAGYLAVSISGAFCGYLAGGFLADRIGRRLTFLVFAIGMSHGAQKMNGIMQDIGRGTHKLVAARFTFRRLFLAGLTALIADAVKSLRDG